jgi:2',3'-cyclic-nucleotide 2'-phosphodiesterase
VNILFIGDVVGKPGRQAVAALVPKLRREHALDLIIANGENAAHGAGLTEATAKELFAAGVDVLTTGDHVWDQKGSEQFIGAEPRVVRPVNFPPGTPGRGSTVVSVGDKASVAVVNVAGRVFMPASECPFRAAQAEVAKLRRQTSLIIVDVHAEATSEKVALGRFLDGTVSAVIGTHTHVATADEQVLPKGTAYLTDAGMCGPYDSVLGREVAPVIRRFVTQMPQKLEVATGGVALAGAVVEVEELTGLARGIRRVRVNL